MRKVQVFLRDEQKAALMRLAARTGRRQSDLIRSGVDLVLESDAQESARWREATRAAAGIWRDREDPEAASSAMRESAKKRFKSAYPQK
jgi:Arc/MetJ-type ribon-helix-helix transcriptional regulator